MERNLAKPRKPCPGCVLCKPLSAWTANSRKPAPRRLASTAIQPVERYRFYVS